MKILFIFIGIYIGAVVDEWSGAIFGFFIGWLAGALIQQQKQLKKLEAQLKLIQSNLIDSRVDVSSEEPVASDDSEQEAVDDVPVAEDVTKDIAYPHSASDVPEEITEKDTARKDTIEKDDAWQTAPDVPRTPNVADKAINWIKDFFTKGNVVVKIGMIVLICGVSFLIKYAAGKHVIPVEFWFIAVAVGSIVLFVVGWRLRLKNAAYALVIQGGAIGLLFITVFAASTGAFKLLPLGLTFALMLTLVVFSSILAVLQDSRSLAVFAIVGGFLAPILISTGSGNHVALFSYYAFLNAGILGIAWHKSWRILNWLGFVFTFVIASLWGYEGYQPGKFNSTEPFLILFFLFYVAISVLFAHRQPPQLKGLVDGSLVFGVPLVGFTLQSALVRDFEYGQALSALAIAALYIILARVLWNKQREGMRMLTESYLALGVIFASLAIPFALDGHWTAASWALEGAGIMWVGIRQNRLLPRVFGLLLQMGGAMAFLLAATDSYAELPILNSAYVGSLFIAVAGVFTGLQLYRHRQGLYAGEKGLHIVLLIWGLLWWFGAGLMEIDDHVTRQYEFNTSLFFIAVSLCVFSIMGRGLKWPQFEYSAIFLLPVIMIFSFAGFVDSPNANPFANLGYISWITAFAIQYWLLYRSEEIWPARLMSLWHAATMWATIFVAAWVISYAVTSFVPGLNNWGDIVWGLIAAIAIAILLITKDRFIWPLQKHQEAYLGWGLLPVVIFSAMWVLVTCFDEGDPAPLEYIPVLNPQDIAQLFSLAIIYEWLSQTRQEKLPGIMDMKPDVLIIILASIAFIWLNSLVAHVVHFYTGVRFAMGPMFESSIFQTSITIVWTVTAFAIMGLASRLSQRKLWFTGAGLLAAVVIKLFIIDLSDLGTVPTIISFMSVGILMLVIGYITPVPPKLVLAKSSSTNPSTGEHDEATES
ncbi:MAG: DUF2339 domain-containing protein [Gammaproteobacteria bacterium]